MAFPARLAATTSVLTAWLIPLTCLGLTWDYLPSYWSQLLLLTLAVSTGVSSLLRNDAFATVGTVFFTLVLANFYLAGGTVSALVITATLFLLLFIVGMTLRFSSSDALTEEDWRHWLLVAFLTAQANSLLDFWAVPFLDRAVISFVAFYLFWQFLQIGKTDKKSLRAHFIFVSLAAILILGTIIWINFPYLRAF